MTAKGLMQQVFRDYMHIAPRLPPLIRRVRSFVRKKYKRENEAFTSTEVHIVEFDPIIDPGGDFEISHVHRNVKLTLKQTS
jgi:hypothetical protein